uniref:Secreted protein n=1 Tax=Romanomermis culicivorax TaxID=13658 RepID=A0A915J4X6_ROMCU
MYFLCKLLLAFASVAILQARVKRDEPDIRMPHFNIDLLDPSFASYNLPQCTSDVNECMKNLHTEAIKCVVKLRANPAAAQCMANDEQVKSGHEQFQKNSFKWHKSVELCLKGQECSGDHCLQSPPPEPVPARFVRVSNFRFLERQVFDEL